MTTPDSSASPPLPPARPLPVRTPLYPPSARGRAPLRVVVLAPLEVPAWLAAFLRFAAENDWIEVSVLLAPLAPPPQERPRLPPDLWLYLALERLRRRGDDGMLARVDIAERARSTRSPLAAGADDLAGLRGEIDALAPDLLLLFGDAATAVALAGCAPQGCWRIGAELADPLGAALGLLPPLLQEDLATAVELRLGFDGAEPVLLSAGNSATRTGSFGLQREQALRKLPVLLLRGLRDLHEGRLPLPPRRAADLGLQAAPAPFAFGSGLRAFAVSARNTVRWWRRIWHGEDPWFLALREAPDALDPAAPNVGATTALVAPAGRYWADPCLVEDGDRRLLFVEEYGYRDSKAAIACLDLRKDGRAERIGIALEEPHHLSYPQVFRHEGVWYMTAESGAARHVWLYRAAGFPLFWEPVAELLGGCLCVDPTLHRHEGRWYLFANVSESGSGNTCDELFLFVADSLSGPYLPHPANPIVRDVRNARPAGRLFSHGGRLIRPAQDCTPDYGAAIVFNEVLELSPTRYRERSLSHLGPSWMPGLWGCHTYSIAGGGEVLDARGHPAPGTPRMQVVDAAAAIRTREDGGSAPVVSVLVPVYNGERFLAQALDSALAQSLAEIEILVVDDGSKDQSGAIADRYAAAHPDRVRVIHQVNQGLPLARNAAIAIARGRYLALLDADDVWLPQHLAECVEVLERDARIGLVHANAEDIDADGRRIDYGADHPRWGPRERDPYEAVLLRRQHIVCPTAVFRRSVVENVGAFDAAFNRLGCEDRDLWLRIAEVAEVVYLDQLHAQYRIHGSNMSANSDRMWRARRLLVDKYARRPRGRRLRRRALAAIDADLGHELALAAPARPALAAFARALLRDPTRVDAWKGLIRRLLIGRRPGVIVPR